MTPGKLAKTVQDSQQMRNCFKDNMDTHAHARKCTPGIRLQNVTHTHIRNICFSNNQLYAFCILPPPTRPSANTPY